MTRSLIRLAAVLAIAAVTQLGWAAPASAHTVTGVRPSDAGSELLSVSPPVAGLDVRLLDLGRRVELVNRGASDVVVLGYLGEPYLRVGPAGVFENERSPAVVINRPAAAGATTAAAAGADPTGPPAWRRVGTGRTVRWRDRRTRWEGPVPAAIVAQGRRGPVAIGEWTISLRRGATPITVTGRLLYVRGPSPLPWVLAALVLLAGTVAAAWGRAWGRVLGVAAGALVAVDILHVYAQAATTAAPLPSMIGHALAGNVVSVGAWVAGACAVSPLWQGRDRGLVLAGGAGMIVALYSGVAGAGVLVHSQFVYALPAVVARSGVAIALGLGLGLVAAVAAVVVRNPDVLRATATPAPRRPGARALPVGSGRRLGDGR